MRSLTSNAATEVAKNYGTEPIIILRIYWDEGGSYTEYADKTVVGVPGKILSVGTIDNVLKLDNSQVGDVTVSLDDTDGKIKVILETTDVHKTKCILYQYYAGLSLSDKFVLLEGEISTPFSWGEGDRQINFHITSEIESFEIGFSPEEGQLDFVSPEAIGKSWPLAFGNVKYVPATRVKQVQSAKLLDNFCIVDSMLAYKLEQIEIAFQAESFIQSYWNLVRLSASTIVPPVAWTLKEYVTIIVYEDKVRYDFVAATDLLTEAKRTFKNDPIFINNEAVLAAEKALQDIAKASAIIYERKKWLEDQIQLTLFAYDLMEKATGDVLTAHNRMRDLYGEYTAIEQEICEQEKCAKTVIRIDYPEAFPDGESIDVCIKKTKFRATVSHSARTLTLLSGPVNQFVGLALDPWQEDDAPCTDIPELDGVNLIWLADNPPPNLLGMYLLVKKKGTNDEDGCVDRHILKVKHQEGQKVYFELIEWIQTGTAPRVSIDAAINGALGFPEGGPVFNSPFPLGAFSNTTDPSIWSTPQGQTFSSVLDQIPQGVNATEFMNLINLVFRLKMDVMSDLILTAPTPQDTFTITGQDVDLIEAVSGAIPESWTKDYCVPYEEIPQNQFFNAPSGTSVNVCTDTCEIYVANILESDVKEVYAYRTTNEGSRILVPIPSSYYVKNESVDLGTYNVVTLTFPQALRNIEGENWEDVVYVTLSSSVGPNVVDIIQWLVETYTFKTVDATNFTAIKAKLQDSGDDLYPANFAIFDRPNVLEEINRICWESRLAAYVVNGVFFLKYLSETPTPVDTFTETDILQKSFSVHYTSTSNLMTKITATYNKDYLPLKRGQHQSRIVLRHNVKKYGLHAREEHFHIYDNEDLVKKSATFWLIRLANTWKKIVLRAPLRKIALETLDEITINLVKAHFSFEGGAVTCIIEKASYDPEANDIQLELHTGIKTGEDVQYGYFWPASVSSSDSWPTEIEIVEGFAGGYGPGSGVIGTFDDCPPNEDEI